MSLSVDDLVLSLSSSHIGQEAIDLATLQVCSIGSAYFSSLNTLPQTQLAQALFGLSSASGGQTVSRDSTQRCNTPTGRTPSSSFSWGTMMDVQRHVATRRGPDEAARDTDDMEDERMVEDILLPSSPTTPVSPFSNHQTTSSRSRSQSRSHMSSISSHANDFPSTDPFYNAQLQAMQNHTSPTSLMSQLGRPSQQSPFLPQQPAYPLPCREPHGFMSSSPQLTLDTHSFLVATAAAFER